VTLLPDASCGVSLTRLVKLISAGLLATVCIHGIASAQTPAEVGRWSPVIDWGVQAKHMILLPTGDVLVWSTGEDARVWDSSTVDSFTPTPFPFGDLHCASQASLADGRVIVAGGQGHATHVGIQVTAIFDAYTNNWIRGQEMSFGRWYATLLALDDGRVLASSGDDGTKERVLVSEIYDPVADTWTLVDGSTRDTLLYPFMYQLPDGRIFEAGAKKSTAFLDINGGGWTDGPTNSFGSSGYSESSCMYRPGKILRAGGGKPAWPDAAVIDMNVASPAWRDIAPMAFGRRRHDLTIMADGKVFAVGGTANKDDPTVAVLPAEIWDPDTELWTTVAALAEERMYHSSTVLLPDGRIVAAGGEGDVRKHAQIYEPPYLFQGPRPTITSAPESAGYGSVFTIATPDAADIVSVALLRAAGATHTYDQNQRYVPLSFTVSGGDLLVDSPANSYLAAPGIFMLIIKNSAGLPSVAEFIKVAEGADLVPGTFTGTVTDAATGTAIAGAAVSYSGIDTTTDALGSYTFEDVPAGEWLVSVSSPGFGSESRSVRATSGEATVADFALVPAGTVTGRVTAAVGGLPIEGADVAYGAGSVLTDADGNYAITDIGAGVQSLRATAVTFEPLTRAVVVTAGDSVTQDFALEPGHTVIEGEVLDGETDEPIVGAVVSYGGLSMLTDEIGFYLFDNVPEGSHTVSASATGYVGQSFPVQVATGFPSTQDFGLERVGPVVETFYPVHDAKVKTTSATTNYGSDTTIRTRFRAGESTYYSYLQFQLTGLAQPPTQATLRLFVTNDSDDGGDVFVVETPIDESTITYENAPPMTGEPIASAGEIVDDQWVELDVTSAIGTSGTYVFGLASNSSNSALYSSKEGANPPEIVLDTSVACTDSTECDDGMYCNGAELCAAGACVAGTLVACNDGVACTVDTCNETTDSCESTPVDHSCSHHGHFCDGTDICDPTLGCVHGAPPDCDDGVGCTADSCSVVVDACVNTPDDALCDDGLFCTGEEFCHPVTGCGSSGDPCGGLACDEATDSCNCTLDADCDDGKFCNGLESCGASGVCESGTAAVCDDGVGCTTDVCSPTQDVCVSTPVHAFCNDDLDCTGQETCHPSLGCESSGNPCGALVCEESTGACLCGGDGDCDDRTDCTVDTCDEPSGACTNTPDDSSCDDGLFCTGTETCDASAGCQDGADRCLGQVCDDILDACLGPPPSVTLEGVTTGLAAGPASVSTDTSIVAVAGDLYLAAISRKSNVTVAEVTGLEMVWTKVLGQCGGRSQSGVDVWQAQAGAAQHGQSGIVTATFVEAPRSAVIAVSHYSGVDSTTPIGNTVSGNTNGADGACSGGSDGNSYAFQLSTTVDRSVVYGTASMRQRSHEPGAGFTEHVELVAGSGGGRAGLTVVDQGVELAGPVAVEGSFNGKVDWALIAMEIRAPSGCSDTSQCNDGLYCNGGEICLDGVCALGALVSCDDGVSCTHDACNEATDGCDNVPDDALCDNGTFCDGVETCDATLDCQPGQLHDCDNGVDCTSDVCDSDTDACVNSPDDGSCDDGLFCTGTETCHPVLGCESSGNPCGALTCDEGTDSCRCGVDADCDDGLSCNGLETCDAALGCIAGTALDCDDGVDCTSDACDPTTDQCANTPADWMCDDSMFCNGAEVCDALLGCQTGTVDPCNDGVHCTMDACDEELDSCSHVPNAHHCNDGLFCNGHEACDPVLGCQTGHIHCPGQGCDEVFDVCAAPTGAPVFMEAASGGSSDSNTVTTAGALTPVAGDVYLAAFSSKPHVDVTAVSGLGMTWQLVGAQCAGRSQTGVSVWSAHGAPTQSGPVTGTFSEAPRNAVVTVVAYSGVAGEAVGAVASANTNGAGGGCSGGSDSRSHAVDLTTTMANSATYAAVALRNRTHEPGVTYTERSEVSQGSGGSKAGLAIEDGSSAAAGTVSVDGTLNGDVDWAIVAVEVKAAATGTASAALPPVPVPAENPITDEKRLLGKILFWDEQMSSDDTVACGTCHRPGSGGADPRVGVHPGLDEVSGTDDDVFGSPGIRRIDASGAPLADPLFGFDPQVTRRAAPTFIGAQYSPELFVDGHARSTFRDPITDAVVIAAGGALESQAVMPPVGVSEMAHVGRDWPAVIAKLEGSSPLALATNLPADVAAALSGSPSYADLFLAAFGDPAISAQRVAFALATYERTLVPDQTPWDAFMAGDATALTADQKIGWDVLKDSLCISCHVPPLFTDNKFHNIGVRPVPEDTGRQEVTGMFMERGRFRTPTLRNNALKSTYMHNGGMLSVGEVVDFYTENRHLQFPENRSVLMPILDLPLESIVEVNDFLENALTDPRVAAELPPFDRPTLGSEVP